MVWMMWGIPTVISIFGIIKAFTIKPNESTAIGDASAREENVEQPPQSTLSNIEGTGSVVYFANGNDKNADREYRFNYKRVNGSWRAYILRMPDLKDRNSSGVVTHRLYDNDKPYVCWDRPVDTLEDMQTISKVWADNIQEYIATGKTFG